LKKSAASELSLARLSAIEGLVVRENFPVSRFTSIGTGGRARFYVRVERVGALKKLMPLINGPWFVLGSGTNLLLSDRDFPGVIIHLGRAFGWFHLRGEKISCGAAVPLARLVKKAVEASFAGFEELSGIPGSVGGAASMNAGTEIKEISDFVYELWMVDLQGNRRLFRKEHLRKQYRTSLVPEPGIITSLSFRGQPGGDPCSQAERARQLINQRKVKHPWQERTFGSTFKNPPGYFAAKLIDQAGLKGLRAGGARVSPVHANFIENKEGASALEILELIKQVRKVVLEHSGIILEPEVKLVGFTVEELGELAPYADSPITLKDSTA